MLSSSFFSDSDSIHRKNSTAGDTSSSTEKYSPARPRQRRTDGGMPRLLIARPPAGGIVSSSRLISRISTKNTTTIAEP